MDNRMPKVPNDATNQANPSINQDDSPTRPHPRSDKTPWRLEVVEAWFERARKAGLKTAEERLKARNTKHAIRK